MTWVCCKSARYNHPQPPKSCFDDRPMYTTGTEIRSDTSPTAQALENRRWNPTEAGNDGTLGPEHSLPRVTNSGMCTWLGWTPRKCILVLVYT